MKSVLQIFGTALGTILCTSLWMFTCIHGFDTNSDIAELLAFIGGILITWAGLTVINKIQL